MSRRTSSAVPREFYSRDTRVVAKQLIGNRLVRVVGGVRMSGTITETEAYGHLDDPASHAYRGMTARNGAMFGAVGMSYVYFTYGMHHCFNIVARSKSAGAGAVLIRAIIPEEGVRAMAKNRGRDAGIADGPAKLAQAMRITRVQCGMDLTRRGSELYVEHVPGRRKTVASPRVGISRAKDRPWNFKIA